MHPSFRRLVSWLYGKSRESPKMGSPKSGGECAIAHIGGAKTIRLNDWTPRRPRELWL